MIEEGLKLFKAASIFFSRKTRREKWITFESKINNQDYMVLSLINY